MTAKKAAPARAKRKVKVPEDFANELREIAMMLREGIHPDAMRSPGVSDAPCGAWLAGLLERLADGASAAVAMGLRGRPPLPSSELLRIHDAYLKKRIAGKSHDKAREAVAKKLFRDVRNVEKAISEARKRGIAKKVTPATLRALRELGGNK